MTENYRLLLLQVPLYTTLPNIVHNRNIMVMTDEKLASAVKGDRVAKVIARAGLCSRREAERLIVAGRVAINGRILETAAESVVTSDQITVDGTLLAKPLPSRLWRYNKPRGLVTTNRDELGRPTIFDHLPKNLPRVITVGRLDLNSEGLLLLTNDGKLARRLELPETGLIRNYRVRVRGRADPDKLASISDGISIEGVQYGPIIAQIEKQTRSNAWLSIALREGRNREVRKICAFFGWPVSRLIRKSFGPFELGQLARNSIAEIPSHTFHQQLGDERFTAMSRYAHHSR